MMLIAVALAATVFAADGKKAGENDSGEKDKPKVSRDYSDPSGIGFDIFIGVAGGLSSSKAEALDTEPARNGTQFEFGVNGITYTTGFSFGLQLGVLQNTLKATDQPAKATIPVKDTTAKTTLAFFELTPAIRFGRGFHVGPVGQAALGTFKAKAENEDAKGPEIFAGIGLAYEWDLNKKSNVRITMQYLTDVSMEARSMRHALLGFGYGLPIVRPYTRVVTKKEVETKEVLVERIVEKAQPKPVLQRKVAMVFDSQTINFITGSSELTSSSQEKVAKIAKFLTENRLLWSKVIIEGHTDKRGSDAVNLKLSEDRALAVGQVLTKGGIDQNRITWAGMGASKPIDPADSEIAYARNRRVELKFDGVTDETALRNGIQAAIK
jgi:outer membrane protein OmpA-like peptidoglycan-associated protein